MVGIIINQINFINVFPVNGIIKYDFIVLLFYSLHLYL